MRTIKTLYLAALVLLVQACSTSTTNSTIHLLNVSYNPTRELYQEVNKAFAADWKHRVDPHDRTTW